MSKNQALGVAFLFWVGVGCSTYTCEIESISEPILAVITEILINLDPIVIVKGGRGLDPHDFVNWWE